MCFLAADGIPSSVIWVSAYGSSRLIARTSSNCSKA